MELAGDEKRIRALYSELSLEEARTAPRFEGLWREASGAQQRGAQRAPRFSKPLVAIAATLLVAVTALFVAWFTYKSPTEENAQTPQVVAEKSRIIETIERQPTPDVRERNNATPDARESGKTAADVREPEKTVIVRGTPSPSNRQRTLARFRQANRTRQQQERNLEQRRLEQQAAMLASWKSPTANFMTSPTRSGFSSLPQLNQSVKDLESFLPKNNESTKESNQ